ncbi:putative sprT-like domain-containing protein Spartan-like [Apostichopus japonicus]|uniref:Putative sprT-like domain-containing protein Spartan-like n=1 Tax=Stichopus japonicus TaxID=307972 RepID=A0A2G8JS76_STIJA|nr:putative sprT-like domain-containing protein Spartan-like [Apostichopus japonicus]
MSSLSDEALAKILQAEFDEEYQGGGNVTVSTRNTSDFTQVSPYSSMPSGSSSSSNSKPLSLIDREWELLDPTPDPRALFLQFNDKFFSGRLAGVEVRWSPRMTLCAGVCSYEGRGGLCSIRLSVPLLKLRPRKDLVETLLHEMIHAYLFVTQNNRDRDGHGPEFCKHKDRINKEAGTKITIYHSFHDEVENYRQHWWRCNGPCQERKPFFGYVKRAMNRAPSHNDTWWADHQRNCGGTFTKIKEPEGYSNKKRKKEANSKEETENESKYLTVLIII